eukprot:6728083-Pyramimonas_sp.AAC.1
MFVGKGVIASASVNSPITLRSSMQTIPQEQLFWKGSVGPQEVLERGIKRRHQRMTTPLPLDRSNGEIIQ